MTATESALAPSDDAPQRPALKVVHSATEEIPAGSSAPALADAALRARILSEIEALVPALRMRARQMIWREEVEDLVQDTVERAIRALGAFTPGTNLRGWLFVIMVHRGRDILRREGLRRSRGTLTEVDTLAAPPPEPPRKLEFSQEEIVKALNEVKEPFREALVMRVLEHKSYAEIAAKQNIPVATAGTRIKRAREVVQAILGRVRKQRGDAE